MDRILAGKQKGCIRIRKGFEDREHNPLINNFFSLDSGPGPVLCARVKKTDVDLLPQCSWATVKAGI